MAFVSRVTLHGRRLGISSSRGLISALTSSTATGWNAAAQMWGTGLHDSVSSSAATFDNAGVTSLTAASATAQSYSILQPVVGVRKVVHIETSASEISLGGTSTAIVFQSTEAGAGSTLFVTSANLAGKSVELLGMSTARYAVVGSTAGITIG